MKQSLSFKNTRLKLLAIVGISVLLPAFAVSSVYASSTTASTTSSTANTAKIHTIITKGDNEITRRLTTLNKLSSKISSTTKLSSSDKTALTTEVSNEISGLTSLKTTLDDCTTIICAHNSAQSIFAEYRVYALVVPKVYLIKTADQQQTVEANLTTIANQLTTRLASSSNTSLQSDLTTMKSDISSAQNLSSSVETSVIGLTPQNYDNNHSLLTQYYSDLKTAHSDNQSAYQEAKTITDGLK